MTLPLPMYSGPAIAACGTTASVCSSAASHPGVTNMSVLISTTCMPCAACKSTRRVWTLCGGRTGERTQGVELVCGEDRGAHAGCGVCVGGG
eukprot:93106-Chlamydomonas_euryale.AAC.2